MRAIAVSDMRMVAMSKHVNLSRQLDSVKATMVVNASEEPPAQADSSRKELLIRRRTLASVLGDLHDGDVNTRVETLALLDADQQKKAEELS